MPDPLAPQDKDRLAALREELLRDRPPTLRPDQGEEALRQHKLLASAIHRASKLTASASDGEQDGWIRYFDSYFPDGRNSADDAKVLWKDWRTSLLKTGGPGRRTPVTHGTSAAHWMRNERGGMCINLEDMWDEFEQSVDTLIAKLSADETRRALVLDRAAKQELSIVLIHPGPDPWNAATVMDLRASASGQASTPRKDESE